MQLFYAPSLLPSEEFFTLDKDESHHVVKVLRMVEGETLLATNGRGVMVRGRIALASPSGVSVRVEQTLEDDQRRPYRLHIAVAPTKSNDRMEWLLEKATEIGVDRITPLICARSERRVYNRERGEKIIISAGKQSLKATFPQLDPPTDFRTFLRQTASSSACCLMAHCMEGERQQAASLLARSQDSIVLIGPEGDFTPEELDAALKAGYVPVSLGQARLRTETAALYAVAAASVGHALF